MKDHAIMFSCLQSTCDVGLLTSYCDPILQLRKQRFTELNWLVNLLTCHLVTGRTKSQTKCPNSSGLPFPVFPAPSSRHVWPWDARWHLCIANSPFPGEEQRQPSWVEGPGCLLLFINVPLSEFQGMLEDELPASQHTLLSFLFFFPFFS